MYDCTQHCSTGASHYAKHTGAGRRAREIFATRSRREGEMSAQKKDEGRWRAEQKTKKKPIIHVIRSGRETSCGRYAAKTATGARAHGIYGCYTTANRLLWTRTRVLCTRDAEQRWRRFTVAFSFHANRARQPGQGCGK